MEQRLAAARLHLRRAMPGHRTTHFYPHPNAPPHGHTATTTHIHAPTSRTNLDVGGAAHEYFSTHAASATIHCCADQYDAPSNIYANLHTDQYTFFNRHSTTYGHALTRKHRYTCAHPYRHHRGSCDANSHTTGNLQRSHRPHRRHPHCRQRTGAARDLGLAYLPAQTHTAPRRHRSALTMWSRDTGTYEFHVGSWSLWLLAAMFASLGTRNPFYLVLVIVISLMVGRAIARPPSTTEDKQYAVSNSQSGFSSLWRIVVIITIGVAVLKGLSYHIGATVLFTLPDWLPVIGGKVALEDMLAAGLDALALLTVLAVFAAFTAGADYYAMLRSVPAAMHGAGLVTSIAITFVPQTIQRYTEIREAQSLRGHRVRRVADLLPMIIPLLAGGMERSMNLAEAMEARGFGRTTTSRSISPLLVQVGLILGLGLLLVGSTMFAFAPDTPLLGWLLIAFGLSLVTYTLWAIGRGTHRTRYRRTVWRAYDTPLAVVSAGILAILLVFKLLAPSLLAYTPFLRISMPDFDPLVALTLCALVAPTLMVRYLPNTRQGNS